MYEVKIIAGEFAGQFVAVNSREDAIREFGDRADLATLREQEVFRVMVNTPDGDVMYAERYSLEEARQDVADNARIGRAAWWI